MGRRIALICALALLAALLLVLPGVAEGSVYFTAINNTLLALEEKTMPVIYRSQLYVPCSVFSSSDLGTYSLYSRPKQLVLISDGERILYFDMSAGSSYDDGGETYSYAAIYQNDTAYVPAFFTAGFFDIRYSYIRSEYGHVVRLTKGEVLSDSAFLQGAAAIMETRLAQYTAAQSSPAPSVTNSPQPTASPPPPTATPAAPPSPSASPTPDRGDTQVYLAILGMSAETKGYMDALETRGLSACFFVTAEDIRREPDLVRRILGCGCGVGALLREDPEKEYGDISALLREAARSVTFLVAAAEDAPGGSEWVREAGLRLWCQGPGMSLPEAGELLNGEEKRLDLVLETGFGTGQFSQLLDRLQRERFQVCTITELAETSLRSTDRSAA